MKTLCERLTAIGFCLFLGIFSLLFWFLPDRAYSETEKRPLEQLPQPEASVVLSGDYAEQMNVYFADQFPFRDLFVSVKAETELLLGKQENNGVLYSEEQLAVRLFDAYESRLSGTEDCAYYYENTVKAQLERVNALADALPVPLITLLPPRSIDVTAEHFAYPSGNTDALYALCAETLSEQTHYLPVLPELQKRYRNGEYVMYRTDHHWTTDGAYLAYCSVCDVLDIHPIPLQSFAKTQIPGFYGTTAARASFPFCRSDTVTLYQSDRAFSVIADGEAMGGLYDFSKADGSDRYSVFLGGTHGITEIRAEGERKTLLVAKDSFADCLIPFLAETYDIVAVDLKTISDLSMAVQAYDACAVLIVWNTENLITNAYLGNVR